MCASYGLCGIVVEVGFLVKRRELMAVRYEVHSLKEFKTVWPKLKNQFSYMFYLFPFEDYIVTEIREYHQPTPRDRLLGFFALPWQLRNFIWINATPVYGYYVWQYFPEPIASFLIDTYNKVLRLSFRFAILLETTRSNPCEQQIRYPAIANNSRYTFTFWAIPAADYPKRMEEYFQFCREHYNRTRYRCNMLSVGYRIAKDQMNYFSYSRDEDMATLDPVSTRQPGWERFLTEYNLWCMERGGQPLFNQTWGLNYDMVETAFGKKHMAVFRDFVKKYDPKGRLLSPYYSSVMGFDKTKKYE
jgi:hypothetical protein